MVALYQLSTNTIISNWGSGIPNFFSIPKVMDVHCPDSTWASGDYMFIPVIYEGSPNTQFSYSTGISQTIANNVLTITTTYEDPPLANIQANLCSQVDAKAEQQRLQYIPNYVGQMGVYILLLNEAKQIVANSSAVANDYPLNASQIGLSGISNIQQAANATLTQASEWIGIASTIEATRLLVKLNIMAANDILSAANAFSSLPW